MLEHKFCYNNNKPVKCPLLTSLVSLPLKRKDATINSQNKREEE